MPVAFLRAKRASSLRKLPSSDPLARTESLEAQTHHAESLEMALVGRLLAAESTLEIQLILVAIYALFWYHFVEKASAQLGAYLKTQPYVHDFTYLSQRTFRSGYYVDLSRE